MKTKLLTFLLSILVFHHGASGAPTDADALVDKYYDAFAATANGDGLLNVGARFRREVPVTERAEFYAKLIDRGSEPSGNIGVVGVVLVSLYEAGPTFAWTPHLERAILALTKREDRYLKGQLVEVLAKKDRAKYQKLCLSYLNDPDDYVRWKAVASIAMWQDGKTTLQNYIQGHSADPAHAKSVQRAQQLVGNMQ